MMEKSSSPLFLESQNNNNKKKKNNNMMVRYQNEPHPLIRHPSEKEKCFKE